MATHGRLIASNWIPEADNRESPREVQAKMDASEILPQPGTAMKNLIISKRTFLRRRRDKEVLCARSVKKAEGQGCSTRAHHHLAFPSAEDVTGQPASDHHPELCYRDANRGGRLPGKQQKPAGCNELTGFGCMWDWGGGDLLFHAIAHAVPLALRSLTTVFGMGTGVASSLESPPQRGMLIRIGVF